MPDLDRSAYPVLQIETQKSQYAGFMVYHSQSQFLPLGRVPRAKRYTKGRLYCASGMCIEYAGGAGKPRFSEASVTLLDNLILPGLAFKLVSLFCYYGPKPGKEAALEVDSFRTRLYEDICKLRPRDKDLPELDAALRATSSYRDLLLAVEDWQYHGGKRDQGGHPAESPEYNPD